MNTQEKAKLYDQLLAEYDEKARQVSLIKSRFDLTREDEKEIDKLKKEMSEIERRANSLGSI
jgi:trehalose-6-phosphate synthase